MAAIAVPQQLRDTDIIPFSRHVTCEIFSLPKRTNQRIFSCAFSGEGGPRPKQREPAGDREVLPSPASEHSDAVGAPGTADSVKRDRSDSAPADVQLFESHPAVDQAEATTEPSNGRLRGRRYERLARVQKISKIRDFSIEFHQNVYTGIE